MNEAAQIGLLALVAVAVFLELALHQKTKLARLLPAFTPRAFASVCKGIYRAVMPEALYNPAPKLNSEQLQALKRRTEEKKRTLKD